MLGSFKELNTDSVADLIVKCWPTEERIFPELILRECSTKAPFCPVPGTLLGWAWVRRMLASMKTVIKDMSCMERPEVQAASRRSDAMRDRPVVNRSSHVTLTIDAYIECLILLLPLALSTEC